MGEILKVVLKGLTVVLPRLSVHARCSFLLKAEVCLAECFKVVNVVKERCKP
jgi:hypothetical protein